MVDKKDLYRQIYLKVDFGLNGDNQIVQKEVPELVQYDNNSGLLVFDFYNNGRKIDLANTRVVVNFKLPSGIGVHDEVTNIRPVESRAMYFTPMGVLYEEGIVTGDIALYRGDVQITSCAKFKYNVIKGIATEEIVDNERFPILQTLLTEVEEIAESARQWEQEFQNKYTEVESAITTAKEQFTTQQEIFDQEFDEQLTGQATKFALAYNQINTTFNNKSETLDRQFNDKSQSLDTLFGEKSSAIDTRFEQKWQDIDNMFHQEDVDAMFQEKFERLEEDFAQDYTDMKETVREVYNTTLKYRIVE